MTQIALPVIDEGDYPEFQRLIPELEIKSYSKWQNERRSEITRRRGLGHTVVPILASPGAFEAWLKGRGRTGGSLASLLLYTKDQWFSLSQPAYVQHNYDPLAKPYTTFLGPNIVQFPTRR